MKKCELLDANYTSRNKERCIVKEREGHYEDNLVCTLLDPRFKLLNFNESTKAMKKDAEKFLRGNYLADWSPKARPPVSVTPSRGDKGPSTSTPTGTWDHDI